MSSPIAKPDKTKTDQILINIHQKISHSTRINILSKLLSDQIVALTEPQGRPIKVLDIGCGDMSMAEIIEELLPQVEVIRTDIHAAPGISDSDAFKWRKYVQFDGVNLPFADQEFDVAYFSDVLHHVPEEVRGNLLMSAARSAKYIVIKDHFEYGWISRQALRLMDWVGNYGYGVSIPVRYFNQRSFETLCMSSGLLSVKTKIGIDLYRHLPIVGMLIRPKWQFIAALRSSFKSAA